jgi:hypothetical protein
MFIVFLEGGIWTYFKVKSTGAGKKSILHSGLKTQLTILLWIQQCIFIVRFSKIHCHVLLCSYLTRDHFGSVLSPKVLFISTCPAHRKDIDSVLRYTTENKLRKCSACCAFSCKVLANYFPFSSALSRQPNIRNLYHLIHQNWSWLPP